MELVAVLNFKGTVGCKNRELFFFIALLAIALVRALKARIHPCLPDFDCNAYISMVNSLEYNPKLLGHHAMRILPSFLASVLHQLGWSIAHAFRILSDGAYLLFAGLLFWVLRQWRLSSELAFAVALLCLASHYAIKIPLKLVYQTCDMLTYPLSLMMIYFSLKKEALKLFLLALLGVITKQTLFLLGMLSLVYCFVQIKTKRSLLYVFLLCLSYFGLQSYYHANEIVASHVRPPEDFFSVSHIIWIINDSKVIELFIPLLPFLLLYFKTICTFLLRYWHIGSSIVVLLGQPILAYHLTGNNFLRLALQGVWLLYPILALVLREQPLSKGYSYLLIFYALAMNVVWSSYERFLVVLVFLIFFVFAKLPFLKSPETAIN